MPAFKIKSPESDKEFAQYFHLRWRLLRAPWGQPEGSEVDKLEPECFHLMATRDDEVIAVARLQFNTADEAQIRYMAVSPESQRHGIGRQMHEPPQVPNFGVPRPNIKLREGLVLAIEPMVNIGDYPVRVMNDDWTVVTVDGSPSAHFEHSVAVTKGGPDVLSEW